MPETIIVVQPAQQTVLSINSNPTSGLVIGVVGPAGPQGPAGASGTGGTGSGSTDISGLVPYIGATANVNLAANSLSAATISALTISATTVSANTISAGKITATSISAFAITSATFTGIAMLLMNGDNSTGGLNTPQMRFGFNNNNSPTDNWAHYIVTRHNNSAISANQFRFYTSDGNQFGTYPASAVLGFVIDGGTASAPALTAGYKIVTTGSISGTSVSAGIGQFNSLSAYTISSGTASTSKLVFGDGTTMITATLPTSATAVPFTGAGSSLNLQNQSFTANTISAITISATTLSAITVSAGTIVGDSISSSTISAYAMTAVGMSAVDARFATAVINSGTFLSLSNLFGTATFVSLSGVGTVLGGSFATAGSVSAGTISANRVQATSISAFTISSGTAATSQIAFADGTTQNTAAGAVSSVSGKNIGGGTNIYAVNESGTGVFRSISAAGGVTITQSGSGIEISSTTASGEANTASNTGSIGLSAFRQKTGVNLEFRTLSAGANLAATTGDLVNSISAISQTGNVVPYTGANAGVNLAANSLTAATISALTISATTLSAVTVSAGVIYTTLSVSSGTLSTGNALVTSLSGFTLSSGTAATSKIVFGDGTSLISATIAASPTAVPFTGAGQGLNLQNQSFTANTVSAITISANSVSSVTLSSGNGLFTSASALLGFAANTISASSISSMGGVSGSNAKFLNEVSLASISAGTTLSAGNIYTAGSVSSGTVSTNSAYLSSLSATATISGNALLLMNGDTTSLTNKFVQAKFGYNSGTPPGTQQFTHYLVTEHNSGSTAGNQFRFYTSDGNAAGTDFTVSAILGLVVDGGTASAPTITAGYKFVTTGSISGSSVSAGVGKFTSVSAFTISSGTAATSQIAFADGTTMVTAPPASQGEANTLTSYGAGIALTAAKAGVALGLFGLSAGSNIGLTRSESLSSVTISAAAGGGSFTGGAIASAYWVALYNDQDPAPTITVNFGTSNVQHITVSAATTATLIGGSAGGRYALLVDQGSTTGSLLLSGSPSAIKWANGTAPGFSTQTGSTDVVSFISDGTVLYGAFTNSNTATNIFYNPPAVSVSSWTNLSMTAGSTSAMLPIVAPAGSRIVIDAVGHWGGVNTESQVTLQAPNSAVIHNVRLRQAAATDKVGFALLATSALTQGWSGTAWVGCYGGTGGNVNVVATIYLGMS